ncbi:hypothetical protein [Chloroflexus sp.]
MACPWELAATHIVRALTPQGVERNVVLGILVVSLRGLLTA